MNQKEPALENLQRKANTRAHDFSIRRDHNPGLLVHGEDLIRIHSIRGNRKTTTSRFAAALAFGVLGFLAASPWSSAHDGKLDTYGCHCNEEGRDYHCHEGTFKGRSFGSKIEMIQQLKLQFLNLGRPWPHDDIAEEDITSAEPKPSQ